MAINSTFYLNAADLTLATSVYLDSSLLNLAPDGFYSDGTISRQQSSGILLTAETCSSCTPQTKCFEGLSEEGGSVTYINANGDTVTQEPIFLGDTVTIQYLSIISYINVEEVVCNIQIAYRSDPGVSDPDTVCALDPDFDTWIITDNSIDVIVNGDIVCNTNNPNDRFDGGNLYYKVYIGIAPAGFEYVCQINENGVITVYTLCPLPPP